MKIFRTKSELRQQVSEWKQQGRSIGFVPTMGALHAGHLSLIDQMNSKADRTIASIFVNPTQFAAHEDLDNYPRTEASDCKKLAEHETDLVYIPSAREIYPDGFSLRVSLDGPAQGLESEARPHFFDGVATVVAKLLLQVRPDFAIFGEKDYQQLLVIQQLVRDLDIDTQIISGPIIRETDGLAMSSRNAYLTSEQRAIAGKLNIILSELAQSQQPPAIAVAEAKQALLNAGFTGVDYAVIRDADTLGDISDETQNRRALIVARLGDIRLLDNMPA